MIDYNKFFMYAFYALCGVLFLCALVAGSAIDSYNKEPWTFDKPYYYCPPQDGLTKRIDVVNTYCREHGEYPAFYKAISAYNAHLVALHEKNILEDQAAYKHELATEARDCSDYG